MKQRKFNNFGKNTQPSLFAMVLNMPLMSLETLDTLTKMMIQNLSVTVNKKTRKSILTEFSITATA